MIELSGSAFTSRAVQQVCGGFAIDGPGLLQREVLWLVWIDPSSHSTSC